MGLECAIITILWVGGQSAIAHVFTFVHGEFRLGILCSKWYAIEMYWEECFSASGGTTWAYCILLDVQLCTKYVDV